MKRWTTEEIEAWYAAQPWLVGCNYIPSTAVNQLEMWQAETFDPETIRRELGWAADLGMNALRVYLHDLVWLEDPEGFKERIRLFLEIADGAGMKTLFVLFDDCWFPNPRTGKQDPPVPGYHNSRWASSPGPAAARDPEQQERLETYVKDIVGCFARDERILLWDVYNELGNIFLPTLAKPWFIRIPRLLFLYPRFKMGYIPTLGLFRKAVRWVREAGPSQPLTAAVYIRHGKLNRLLIESSDILSFHNYENVKSLERQIRKLKKAGRPLLCTEYLNRCGKSRFGTFLPVFRREKIGCFNWGLVDGKTQTKYSWQHPRPDGSEPPLWFHDIFHSNGTPYDPAEIEFFENQCK